MSVGADINVKRFPSGRYLVTVTIGDGTILKTFADVVSVGVVDRELIADQVGVRELARKEG